MATPAPGQKAPQRARAPDVNLFDLPELMPGAQPSANPAQREEFEQRCRHLHMEEMSERHEQLRERQAASGAQATHSELELMFPTLDPALIRTLAADSPSPQMAIETLLALSAAMAEPVSGAEGSVVRATTPPPRNLGVEDHEKFPALIDGDGWQVMSQRIADRDPEEELGSAWRDRAKAAKDLPAPKAAPAANLVPVRKQKPPKEAGREQQEFMTDYEFRQRAGQRRAIRRAQYGRGGRGRGAGGAAAAGEEDSETEEEEAEAGGGCGGGYSGAPLPPGYLEEAEE